MSQLSPDRSSGRSHESARRSELDGFIVRAQEGSIEDLDALVEKLWKQLREDMDVRRRKRHAKGSNGSSDLVQDTVLRIRESFRKFPGSTYSELVRWARVVLDNRRREWYRNETTHNGDRHQREIWARIQARIDAETTGESAILTKEDAKYVNELLEGLPGDQQYIIQLHLLNGMTFPAIAAMANRNADAVRRKFHRAMEHLRRQAFRDEP